MRRLASLFPERLDLVMRDEDFVIYYDGATLTTPGGAPFAHKNARVLKHILVKLTLNKGRQGGGLTSLRIFVMMYDHILENHDFISTNFNRIFEKDFVVSARFGDATGNSATADEAIDYLAENQDVMNLVFWSNSMIMEGFRSFLLALLPDDGHTNGEVLKPLILEKYASLTNEQKATVNLLSLRDSNGVVLPLMLVLGYISPSEYANSTLAVHARFAARRDSDFKSNIADEYDVEPQHLDPAFPLDFVRRIHEEALKALEFLRYFTTGQRKVSVITELISMGESDQLEFKSTFRWDLRQEKKNPAIEHASLKTMAAFLNTEGGDLLIGVEDDGNILGVEMDKFPNDDKFLLHLWSLIKSSMGQEVSPYIKTTLENFDGKTVCRVHCKPSPKPIFLRQKGFDESFYIRIGPSTGSLEISEALQYIADRFKAG